MTITLGGAIMDELVQHNGTSVTVFGSITGIIIHGLSVISASIDENNRRAMC